MLSSSVLISTSTSPTVAISSPVFAMAQPSAQSPQIGELATKRIQAGKADLLFLALISDPLNLMGDEPGEEII